MLVAYIDESPQPKERVPVMAVGGAIGTGKQWSTLLKAWRRAIDVENIDIFHTRDFETPEGRIGTVYETWDEPRRRKFQQSLIDAVTANPIDRIVAAIVRQSDSEAVANSRPEAAKHGINAYYFCAYMLIEHIARWTAKVYGNDQRVTYYFEQGGPHQPRLERAYAFISEHEASKQHFKFWLTPTFAPKDSHPGLQVADKCVYEACKHAAHYLDESPPLKHSILSPSTGKSVWKPRYPAEQWVLQGVDFHPRMFDVSDIEEFFCSLEDRLGKAPKSRTLA